MSREASPERFMSAVPILLRVAVLGLLMSSSAMASGQTATSAQLRAARSLAQANEAYGRQAYAEAATLYEAAIQDDPWDSLGYMQLAGFYNRQGQFGKTIAALEERASIEPTNPEAYYVIATYYWDKAFRDVKLSNAKKEEFVGKGLESIERAL